jgi:hypothetical protein
MKLNVAFSKCKCKSTLFVGNGNWIVYTNLTALIDWKSFRSWWQPCRPLSVSSSQQVSSAHSLWGSGELTYLLIPTYLAVVSGEDASAAAF